jgi:hypothetical protein
MDIHRENTDDRWVGFHLLPIQPFLMDSFQAFADLHGCLDLLAVTNTYIESHFSEVLDCDEFYALSAEQVRLRNDPSVTLYVTASFDAITYLSKICYSRKQGKWQQNTV